MKMIINTAIHEYSNIITQLTYVSAKKIYSYVPEVA